MLVDLHFIYVVILTKTRDNYLNLKPVDMKLAKIYQAYGVTPEVVIIYEITYVVEVGQFARDGGRWHITGFFMDVGPAELNELE